MEDLTQSQETTDKFVMPEREELHIFGDEHPEKPRQIGEPIEQKIGLAVLDTRRVKLLPTEFFYKKAMERSAEIKRGENL